MEAHTDMTKDEAREPSLPLWAVIYDPAGYLERAVRALPASHALIAFTAACFFQVLSVMIVNPPSTGFGVAALTGGFFVQLAFRLLVLLFAAVVVHFFASSSSRGASKGSGWRLLSLFFVCQAPYLFLPPAAILARAAPAGSMAVYALLSILVGLWSIVLMIVSVRKNYAVTTAWAVLVLLAPGLFALAGAVVLPLALALRVLLVLGL